MRRWQLLKLRVLENLDRNNSGLSTRKLLFSQIDVSRTTSVAEERLSDPEGFSGVEITCRTTTTVVRVKSQVRESIEILDGTTEDSLLKSPIEKTEPMESEIKPDDLKEKECLIELT